MAERLSVWGQQYCVKKDGEYIDNVERGATLVKDTVSTLLCVEIDNSPELGRFYDLPGDNDVSETTVATLETNVLDYSDTLTATKDYSPEANFAAGDFLVSYVNQAPQIDYRWVIPSADSFGVCTDTNYARWMENQDLPPCTRKNFNCGGPLDPATYTSAVTVGPSPLLLGAGTAIPISQRSVKLQRSNGVVESFSGQIGSSGGSSCACSNILLEAHYIVITDAEQTTIKTVYADIVVGNTFSCVDVEQKFSLTFVSADGTTPRSGNPGYIIGKPVLVKYASIPSLATMQLGGMEQSGACTSFPTSSATTTAYPLLGTAPTVAFRAEMVFSCYESLTFVGLQNYCSPDETNSRAVLFQNLPQFVAKFGNAEYATEDDFVSLLQPTPVLNKWNDAAGECTLQSTMVLEFITAEVGSDSNPQPKIIYARAYFRENTYYVPSIWRFQQWDKSVSQRFYNTLIVTFVRYDEDTDFYKPVGRLSQDTMPDVYSTQDIIYPWRANSAMQLCTAAVLALISA